MTHTHTHTHIFLKNIITNNNKQILHTYTFIASAMPALLLSCAYPNSTAEQRRELAVEEHALAPCENHLDALWERFESDSSPSVPCP